MKRIGTDLHRAAVNRDVQGDGRAECDGPATSERRAGRHRHTGVRELRVRDAGVLDTERVGTDLDRAVVDVNDEVVRRAGKACAGGDLTRTGEDIEGKTVSADHAVVVRLHKRAVRVGRTALREDRRAASVYRHGQVSSANGRTGRLYHIDAISDRVHLVLDQDAVGRDERVAIDDLPGGKRRGKGPGNSRGDLHGLKPCGTAEIDRVNVVLIDRVISSRRRRDAGHLDVRAAYASEGELA